MEWNYLPLVEMAALDENAATLLRDFLARNKITVGFRPGENVEDHVIERWHGSSTDHKGTIHVRPALGRGLTHDNVTALKAAANEIVTLAESDTRIVLLDVPKSVAKALAVVANLTYAPTKVIDGKLDIAIETAKEPVA